MKSWKVATVFAVSAVSGSAVAATNPGALADPAEGDTTVTITKSSAAFITGIEDIAFTEAATFGGDVTESDDVCVFSTSGIYTVKADGTNNAGNFELQNVATDTLAYTVTWADATGGGTDALTAGDATGLETQTGQNTDSACGTDNASYSVTIAQAAFNAAQPGVYQDVLTLSIEVE